MENGFPEGVAEAVVFVFQIVNRVDFGEAGNDDAAGVQAQLVMFGPVNIEAFPLDAVDEPGTVFGGGGAEIPVTEGEIRRVAEEVPADDAAGVDEMGFDVAGTGDFVLIEGGFRETAQRVEGAALQEFGQRPFQGNGTARMCAKAGVTALVVRVEQGDADHREAAAERSILDPHAESGSAQGGQSGDDLWAAGNDLVRHLGQAQPFAQDAEFHVAFDNFGERLRLRFCGRIAGGEAVADVKIAEDVEWEPDLFAVAQAREGQGADAAFGVAGVEIDQQFGIDTAFGVVEGLQFRGEQGGRPAVIFRKREPAFFRVMGEALCGLLRTQPVLAPEMMAGKALEEFAQRTGACRELRTALAVGVEQRTVAVDEMHRPEAVHGLQPGAFLKPETKAGELRLHAGDRGLKRGVLAGKKVFGCHGCREE